MSTLSDAMDAATAELTASRIALDALRVQATAQLAVKTTAAQTVINNFLGRPPVVSVFCDPVNGDDAHDGSTPDLAKKSLDGILDAMGTSATSVVLLADTTLRRRRNIYASLTIYGGQKSSSGWIFYSRQITLLGTAENSPDAGGATFGAGVFLFGGNVLTNRINFLLGDAPDGQTYRGHIHSDYGANIVLVAGTLLVSSAAAKALFSAYNNTLNASLSIVLGSGAAGHLFDGVAASANPNSNFNFRSNVTSA